MNGYNIWTFLTQVTLITWQLLSYRNFIEHHSRAKSFFKSPTQTFCKGEQELVLE